MGISRFGVVGSGTGCLLHLPLQEINRGRGQKKLAYRQVEQSAVCIVVYSCGTACQKMLQLFKFTQRKLVKVMENKSLGDF